MYDYLRLKLPGDGPMKNFFAGAISGMISNLSVYPLEFARTRMAMQGAMAKYKLNEIIKLTFKREGGLVAFYKGALASMVGVWLYKGVGFTVYEAMKKMNQNSLKDSLNFLNFSSGATAAFIGQLVSYPIEVTKRRMQVSGSFASGDPQKYSSKLPLKHEISVPHS